MRELLTLLNVSCAEYNKDHDPVLISHALHSRLSEAADPIEWTIADEWFDDQDLIAKVTRNKKMAELNAADKKSKKPPKIDRRKRRNLIKEDDEDYKAIPVKPRTCYTSRTRRGRKRQSEVVEDHSTSEDQEKKIPKLDENEKATKIQTAEELNTDVDSSTYEESKDTEEIKTETNDISVAANESKCPLQLSPTIETTESNKSDVDTIEVNRHEHELKSDDEAVESDSIRIDAIAFKHQNALENKSSQDESKRPEAVNGSVDSNGEHTKGLTTDSIIHVDYDENTNNLKIPAKCLKDPKTTSEAHLYPDLSSEMEIIHATDDSITSHCTTDTKVTCMPATDLDTGRVNSQREPVQQDIIMAIISKQEQKSDSQISFSESSDREKSSVRAVGKISSNSTTADNMDTSTSTEDNTASYDTTNLGVASIYTASELTQSSLLGYGADDLVSKIESPSLVSPASEVRTPSDSASIDSSHSELS